MRRRRKTKLRPKPFFVLFLLINLAVGAVNSRITSVSHVEVIGVPPYDQGRVTEILSRLQGVPYSHVHAHAIETETLRNPAVRSVTFSRNPFGSGRLKVEYRQAVARLASRPNVGLDLEGAVFATPDLPKGLPLVTLPNSGPPTLLTLAANWDSARLAQLAVESRAFAGTDGVSIQVDDGGAVYLSIGQGRVVLGSLEDLDKKLRILRERLRANPMELSQVKELNLTQPDSPAVVPREEEAP